MIWPQVIKYDKMFYMKQRIVLLIFFFILLPLLSSVVGDLHDCCYGPKDIKKSDMHEKDCPDMQSKNTHDQNCDSQLKKCSHCFFCCHLFGLRQDIYLFTTGLFLASLQGLNEKEIHFSKAILRPPMLGIHKV